MTHPVYPGGPTCQPACPGPSSMYHDGYADGYEAGERLAPTLVFETAESEATVRAAPITGTRRTALTTKGAVSGRIQTVSNRGGLRFTLYDAIHDRAISCYLTEGREDDVLGAWGKFAIVEGMVRRDPETGRAASIRGITDVQVRPDGAPDAYLEARGAVPGPFLMTADEAVRRSRDADGHEAGERLAPPPDALRADGGLTIGPIRHDNGLCRKDGCTCWCQVCERHNWRHDCDPA